MPHHPIVLGLGCSRFGSLANGVSPDDAVRLLHAALDLGVSTFDTADIYGQGDSERFLGRHLPRDGSVSMITKAGQRFSPLKRLMIPAKPLLRPLVQRIGGAKAAVQASRAGRLPVDLSPGYLRRALDASLCRLQRDRVDIFLLHSPTIAEIHAHDAIATLAALRAAGKAERVGVSVDDVETARALLGDPRVEVLQVPLSPTEPGFAAIVEQASTQGVTVILREILGGTRTQADIDHALAFAASQPADVALLGTSNHERLGHARSFFAARNPTC